MKILIADDDANLRLLLSDFLGRQAYEVVTAKDGVEARQLSLEKSPDLIILDVDMPGMSGLEVCRILRKSIRTRYIPILFLTGKREIPDKIAGLSLGADDYLAKPFNAEELKIRIENLLRRSRHQLAANPLTKLPGGPLIEEEAARLIEAGLPLAFLYIDIDNFKAYNDVYGYKKGDEVIGGLARILIEVAELFSAKGDNFIGHIGGDDFALITQPPKASPLAEEIARRFDAGVGEFYGETDRTRGFLETLDRKGDPQRFPLMTLSIAVVTNDVRPIEHYGRLAELASELKHFAKSTPDRKKSLVVTERRKE